MILMVGRNCEPLPQKRNGDTGCNDQSALSAGLLLSSVESLAVSPSDRDRSRCPANRRATHSCCATRCPGRDSQRAGWHSSASTALSAIRTSISASQKSTGTFEPRANSLETTCPVFADLKRVSANFQKVANQTEKIAKGAPSSINFPLQGSWLSTLGYL